MRSCSGPLVAVALLILPSVVLVVSCSPTNPPPDQPMSGAQVRADVIDTTDEGCLPANPAPTESELLAQLTAEQQAMVDQVVAAIIAGGGDITQVELFGCDNTVLPPSTFGRIVPKTPNTRYNTPCAITSTTGAGPNGLSFFCSDRGLECRTLFTCTQTYAMPGPAAGTCTGDCPSPESGDYTLAASFSMYGGMTAPPEPGQRLACMRLGAAVQQARCATWKTNWSGGNAPILACQFLLHPPLVSCVTGGAGGGGPPAPDAGATP